MSHPVSTSDARRIYDDIVVRAMHHAARRVPRAEAYEVAHDVACVLLRRQLSGVDDATDARTYEGFIYRAVWNRLNNLQRGGDRRASAERIHLDERTRGEPGWITADGALAADELMQVVDQAIAEMPAAMRRVFLMVRLEELSYQEAASRLGIGVGTVHTQLARASQRLRQVIEHYRGADAANHVRPTNATSTP